jgi:hypothetical protein
VKKNFETYSSRLARLLIPSSSCLAKSLNRYSYVLNNSGSLVDPSGQCGEMLDTKRRRKHIYSGEGGRSLPYDQFEMFFDPDDFPADCIDGGSGGGGGQEGPPDIGLPPLQMPPDLGGPELGPLPPLDPGCLTANCTSVTATPNQFDPMEWITPGLAASAAGSFGSSSGLAIRLVLKPDCAKRCDRANEWPRQWRLRATTFKQF